MSTAFGSVPSSPIVSPVVVALVVALDEDEVEASCRILFGLRWIIVNAETSLVPMKIWLLMVAANWLTWLCAQLIKMDMTPGEST